MMSVLFFGLVTLAVLFGSHYLLYATTVRFFAIASPAARTVLKAAVLVLAVGFILSALLLRVHRNPVTEGFAWVAAVWLGLMLHLIAAMALIWLVRGVATAARYAADMRVVCGTFYALAAIATAYGAVNALHPRVKEVSVELEGLPDQWEGETLVHISDVHLGSIRRVGFLRSVVEKINALEPALILITGDLFDGMGGNLGSFAELLDSLDASKGVFFVTGNHEGYLGLTEPLSVLERARIRVLDDEVVDVDGLQIVGVSFPEFDMEHKARSVSRLGDLIDPAKPSILLYHTPTDVAGSSFDRAEQQAQTYLSPDVEFSFARTHGIDLQLSGHTHEGQVFPFTYLTKWIFGGYHYGLHAIDGFSLYVTSGVGTWGPPLRTGSRSEIVAIRLDSSHARER